MAKYYVKMDELKAEGEEIQEYAKNVVDASVQELISLADKLEWTGPTHEMFINLFTDKVFKIKRLANMIELYGKFIVMAADGYTEVNDKFAQEMKKINEELERQKEKLKNLQG